MTNLVAVYGSLRAGLGNHRLLTKATLVVPSQRVAGFDMYSMGGFPFITHGSGEITIEVYAVTEPEMRSLDRLEGYPSFYNRELIETQAGLAWIYFIDGENTSRYQPVPSGDWFEFYKEKF